MKPAKSGDAQGRDLLRAGARAEAAEAERDALAEHKEGARRGAAALIGELAAAALRAVEEET